MSALTSFFAPLTLLTPQQRKTVVASYLGWMLDAFDFFILVFVLVEIAKEFGTTIESVSVAIFLTLAVRPIGALVFGLAADRIGRRPVLMTSILLYSGLEFASGFATDLTMLIVLRTLYGIVMGGEWGVGASLAMETVPSKVRGLVSGILQSGYPAGYLLASLFFFLLFDHVGWRGLFMLGSLPALVVLFIRRNVDESPAFVERAKAGRKLSLGAVIKGNGKLIVWAALMMAAFNFMSHGTQDLYPTFLETQRHLDTSQVGLVAIVYNFGAVVGSIFFGGLSDRAGRRRSIAIAAILALPALPLWAFGGSPAWLAVGGFLVQFCVQGAWGVVPVHLNELSPEAVRGTFPGLVYQTGNLIASSTVTLQAMLTAQLGGNYALALALFGGAAAVAVTALVVLGPEAKGIGFGGSARDRRANLRVVGGRHRS
ncbi:MFS transporter, SHS family, lactate transporter [Pseudoxanthobacter soli DSM 19599]|uniref:MFS transporter, SHS family, lactate transporter n=1 Tax=Pseudoxanthobacter soli DSM 19599 TaxID=1123029 RepID=A0A1M7Z768_9HYPH|nr:MFS transporter [Pseudoxanthobacter soli]SHO60773.1 MFS transporter, SHS family, lactate transporter [Pseudoxanthobacter soli DSM 19599]